MNIKKCIVIFLMALLNACGGDSDSNDSQIDGTWRGNLIQGVIVCNDGTAIGAGGGSTLREVVLEITGSDVIGSAVQLVDGNCLFEGSRNAEGFTANATSGCDQGLTAINFTILEDSNAAISYQYDIDKVPAGDNGIRCKISPSASVSR